MANVVVVGAQWGDEGKGKLVDWLSERADVIVRFQGGHNAGHTLVIDGKVYKLSLLPSGIVRSGKLSVIGNGVVLDPWHLKEEIAKLQGQGVPVFNGAHGHTQSHQFAVLAAAYGGGQAASKQLRRAGFLACGIGLPVAEVAGDLNGLRIGTPELVRWGMTEKDAPQLAAWIAKGLFDASIAPQVAEWPRRFDTLHFVH